MTNSSITLAFIDTVRAFENVSKSRRKKCAAIIVKDTRIISTGYNGTPAGYNNEMETCNSTCNNNYACNCTADKLITRTEVIHAEANAILFAAKHGLAINNCTMFTTTSPCMECAKMIIQAGIKTVYFGEKYRDENPLAFLKINNVKIKQWYL